MWAVQRNLVFHLSLRHFIEAHGGPSEGTEFLMFKLVSTDWRKGDFIKKVLRAKSDLNYKDGSDMEKGRRRKGKE